MRKLAALGVVTYAFHCAPAAAEPLHQLHVVGGLGITGAYLEDEDIDAVGTGVLAQAEYVYAREVWVTPRAYAGFSYTTPDDCAEGVAPCDVSAKIGYLGGKVRLLAPIPYVAPFFELGVGVSLGSLSTQVEGLLAIDHQGAAYHIPFTLGIAFGEHRDFELSLHYLFHPEQNQFSGAVAFGIGFALTDEDSEEESDDE